MTDQLPPKFLTTPVPANETERLAALHRYKILDTPPEAAFDRITTLAARLFNMPIALISLVDESRAWFKSCIGFDAREVPRDATLCSFAVLTNEPLIIPDTRLDERFACNGFVQSEPGVRFYAGAPLLTRDGFNLGTLCLLDTQPRDSLSAEQQATLVDLAAMVVDEFELRLAAHKVAQSEEQIRNVLESITDAFFTLDKHWRFTYVNGAAETLLNRTRGDLIGQSIWSAYPGLDGSEFEQLYWRVMRERLAASLTAFYPDHERWYEVRIYPAPNGITVYFKNVTEQMQAEAALRQSEQQFRLMADAVPQIVWITDAQGRVEFFNKQWSDYTGVPYEPTTAAEVAANFVHLEDVERTVEAFNEARRTGDIFSVEHRIRSAAGTYRWFLVRAQPYCAPQTGEIIRWFGASIDIHDRKQAEATLREREQRLTIATEAAQLGIFEWKVPEDITVWENERLYEIFGLTPADGSVSSQEFFERYLHPDDAEALSANMTEAMQTQTGSLRQTSYRICRQDGTIRWLEVNGQFEFAADGSPLRFVGVNADITERKQAEATIVQREAQFRQLAEAMPQQVWITDAQGNTQYVNQQWKTYTGLTLEQTQDIDYAAQVIHPDDFELTSELLTTALATGTPYQAEFRLKQQVDQTYRWFLSRAIAIRNEQGQIVQWFGTSTDIEEFRRAQAEREQLLAREQTAREAAERANRVKDEFLAVLSHELRSPLNPILGWARLLQNGKLDPTRQTEALKTIERNAKLQAQLIEDLLDISRIMQGKLSLTVAPVSLTVVISAALETVRLAASAKNITLVLDIDPKSAPVSGDATRLQQVMWNLLTNAVKFTPNGGQVTLELRQFTHLAQIRVIDTGKGINPQFLPHVFEYFRQEDGSTTRKFGGLGLGLAIVRQIVEMHSGTVKAESRGENQGATFIVQLPLMQQAAPPLVPEPTIAPADTTAPLDNIQILLVDNEPDTREFQAFLLEQSGAKVTAVASGLEALQVLDQLIPDVLVSDVGMADMDGYMLIGLLRARPPNQGGAIPALALTAYAAEVDRQRAIEAGFQTFLTKPVEAEILVKAIITLLDANQPEVEKSLYR
jgi:PAS domain S-box-containing protein